MNILYSTHAPEAFGGEPDEDGPSPEKVLYGRLRRATRHFLCDACHVAIEPGAIYAQVVTLDRDHFRTVRRVCKDCGGGV